MPTIINNKGTISKSSNESTETQIIRAYRLGLFFVTALLSLMICSSKAQAQLTHELEAEIPFSFHAGNAKLPAGKYMIRVLDDTDPNLVEISSTEGATAAVFEVRPTGSKSVKTELVFNRYGNRYFLEQLFDQADTAGSELIESRYEKRVAEAAAEGQEHVPALSRKRE